MKGKKVQISNNHQNVTKYNANPAFYGLTHVFKNRLFSNGNTYEQLMAIADKQPYIGSLPKEIIEAISAVTHSKAEKTAFIKKVMDAFSQASKELRGTERGNDSISFHKAKAKDFIPKQKEAAIKAGKILTSVFKSLDLIKKGEKITVKRFKENEGMYGVVFNISFPKRTNWNKKVIKIFKDIKAKFDWDKLIPIHGISAEANAGMFVTKQQRTNYRKSIFVQPYLASLKDNFLLLEHAKNYPSKPCDKYKLSRAFERFNIFSEDITAGTPHNMLNGRVIDYGGIVYNHENLTPDAYKVFLALSRADIKSINTGSDKPIIDALIKYVRGSQKETKVSRFDADRGVEVFMGNAAFSEETKNTLVTLGLFKPEQICTY